MTAQTVITAAVLIQVLSAVSSANGNSDEMNVSRPYDGYVVTLGGEVGAAARDCNIRFQSVPFDSLPWLRADLTGETVSEFDTIRRGNIQRRPFKNYSGDVSGRFIEIMAMNSNGSYAINPLLKDLLSEVLKHQREGGYFAAFGDIDWQQPIDRNVGEASPVMMPALWGNARLLCGMVEASRAFKDEALLVSARKLGDFYVDILPRFTDPARMKEYKDGTTYSASYVTCYFPAMEGLVKLYGLTNEKKYLDTAIKMAEFYKSFDTIPIDHAHGMLCGQVSLLMLYDVTKDTQYLERVEKRWVNLVKDGYINPAGGTLEKCAIKQNKDEGCALADWIRLNLELARVTGKTRYLAMAERTLYNHFFANQSPMGGFGHRTIICDDNGVVGFASKVRESTWCCSYHGELAFLNLIAHLTTRTDKMITSNFTLDFTSSNAVETIVSEILPGVGSGEVLRQRLSLSGMPEMVMRVRQPHWADAVTAIDAKGKSLPLVGKDGFFATSRPVSEAVFIFAGGVYAENRRCERLSNGPEAGEPCVFGYGPKLLARLDGTTVMPSLSTWPVSLADLEAQGLAPMNRAMRNHDCCFVFTLNR